MFEFKLLHTSPLDPILPFKSFSSSNTQMWSWQCRPYYRAQLTKGPHCCTLKLVSALALRPCLPWADPTITGRNTNEDLFLGDTALSTLTVNFVSKTRRWLCWTFPQPSCLFPSCRVRLTLQYVSLRLQLPISFHGCISLNKLLAHLILSLHLLLSAWTNTHMPFSIPQTAKEGRGNGPS